MNKGMENFRMQLIITIKQKHMNKKQHSSSEVILFSMTKGKNSLQYKLKIYFLHFFVKKTRQINHVTNFLENC
jgi:hypothetical protein